MSGGGPGSGKGRRLTSASRWMEPQETAGSLHVQDVCTPSYTPPDARVKSTPRYVEDAAKIREKMDSRRPWWRLKGVWGLRLRLCGRVFLAV